jgi:hypothetical protein
MLAASLALGAYLVYSEPVNRERGSLWSSVPAGALAGLALMAHGGIVFGLIPALGHPLVRPSRRSITNLVVVGVAVLIVVTPWMLWQRLVDPPGNALVKFAFAGTWGFGEEAKGVWHTIRDVYAPLTFFDWLRTREQAALTYFGLYNQPFLPYLPGPRDWPGRQRLVDFLFFFPSLREANMAWALVILAGFRRTRRNPPETSTSLIWIRLGLAGLLISAVVGWNMHVNHHHSYLSLVLVFVGLYVLLVTGPPLLRAATVGLHFAYFSFVWLLAPLVGTQWRIDYLVALCAVAAWTVAIFRSASPRSVPLTPTESWLRTNAGTPLFQTEADEPVSFLTTRSSGEPSQRAPQARRSS